MPDRAQSLGGPAPENIAAQLGARVERQRIIERRAGLEFKIKLLCHPALFPRAALDGIWARQRKDRTP